MNPIDPETLRHGLDYGRYREGVKANGETFDEVYEAPASRPEDLAFLRRLPPLDLVALAEDWCPDVFHTLPTWARLVEELEGWRLLIFPRDEHPELMEAFLWQGTAKRIPVYAFYDKRGFLQTWWSGRGREAQEALDGILGGRAFDELDDATRQRAVELFERGYPERFRRANLEEILVQLGAFFHVAPGGAS